MKNLKLNINRVISSIDGEVTNEAIIEAIRAFEKTYTFVASKEDAEGHFQQCEIAGEVYERESKRFYTDDFEIVVYEYYVDPGSVDYVYSVRVFERA